MEISTESRNLQLLLLNPFDSPKRERKDGGMTAPEKDEVTFYFASQFFPRVSSMVNATKEAEKGTV